MKSFITILSVIILLGSNSFVQAQRETFSLISHDQTPRAISVRNGLLIGQAVTAKTIEQTQKFIFKRQTNGNILIASAAHPEMCLKHTGTSVELVKFDGNVAAFEWRIEFVNDDQYLFKHATKRTHCLTIDEKNELTVSAIEQMKAKKHFECCLFMLVQEEYPF